MNIEGSNLDGQFANMRVGGAREHCPVIGCFCSAGSGHVGWPSGEALKAHVNSHLDGVYSGEVPQEWLASKGWVVCQVCHQVASASRRGGIHEGCAARMRSEAQGGRDEWAHLEDGWEEGGWARMLRSLPPIHDFCYGHGYDEGVYS